MALIGLLITSNLFWIVVSIGLRNRSHSGHSIYATDFISSDPLPFRPQTIVFDDLLEWNTTSQEIYRQMNPSLPLYFGPPSPAIDEAWNQLMRYEYPAISDDELERNPSLKFAKSDVHPLTGKHHFALDVFHNLHCLNAVRMELDKDYYGAQNHHGHVGRRADHMGHEKGDGAVTYSAVEAAQRDHIDHCLNHIRQALQCRPDFSPAAMNVFTDTDGGGFFLGNAKRHSCVDWESVMEWAAKREEGSGYAQIGDSG